MGDYRDRTSIISTVKSYMKAFRQVTELCPHLEPTASDFNRGSVLPTTWRPSFGYNRSLLYSKCTEVNTRYDSLFDSSTPKIISERHTLWSREFFTVYCSISIPFDIYDWDMARQVCEGGFDEEGNCPGGYTSIPPKMKPWSSPRYLRIEVLDSSWGKSWGLRDWNTKYDEICDFGKQFPVDLQDKYNKGVVEASTEVAKWEEAIENLGNLRIPRGVK